MESGFELIKKIYRDSFEAHGVSSSAMLMPKGRHDARFGMLCQVLSDFEAASLLDYGCGLGFLCEYLQSNRPDVQYCGMDMVDDFIESCLQRLGTKGRFEAISPDQVIDETFDVVYASGVFNLSTSADESESLNYVRDRLHSLFAITRKALVVDFLSPDVDFVQTSAQHIRYETVLNWFVPRLTRRWSLLHHYLPYEYSLVLYRDDRVFRPTNTFRDFRDSD